MAPLRFIKEMSKIEIYKYLHGLSPTILNDVFKVNETIPYDLRMRNELYARNPKTVRYGTETISFLSPKIWCLIPQNMKDSAQQTFVGLQDVSKTCLEDVFNTSST